MSWQGTSSSLTKVHVVSCIWGGVILHTIVCCRLANWKEALQRPWGSRWTASWTWANTVPLWQRKLTDSSAPLGGVLSAACGMWSFPSTQHQWVAHSMLCPVLAFPGQERHWLTCQIWRYWSKSSEGPQWYLRGWNIYDTERGWERWNCLA